LIDTSHSFVAWLLGFITAFAIARTFCPFVRGTRARATISRAIIVALLASLYLEWAHHRAMSGDLRGLVGAFPYPDRFIDGLGRWFEARNPSPSPEFVKWPGVRPRVGFILGVLVLISTSLLGWLVGMLWSQPRGKCKGTDPLGLLTLSGFPKKEV
jgi:hypothetical protein